MDIAATLLNPIKPARMAPRSDDRAPVQDNGPSFQDELAADDAPVPAETHETPSAPKSDKKPDRPMDAAADELKTQDATSGAAVELIAPAASLTNVALPAAPEMAASVAASLETVVAKSPVANTPVEQALALGTEVRTLAPGGTKPATTPDATAAAVAALATVEAAPPKTQAAMSNDVEAPQSIQKPAPADATLTQMVQAISNPPPKAPAPPKPVDGVDMAAQLQPQDSPPTASQPQNTAKSQSQSGQERPDEKTAQARAQTFAAQAPVTEAAPQQNAPQAAQTNVAAAPVQAASAPQIQTTHAPILVPQSAPILVPPEALGVFIARKFTEGSNRFDIRLDPPELGRLDVTIETDETGQTRAHIRAERPEALELLQREAKGMEQALRQAGLQFDAANLTFSLNDRQRDAAHEHGARERRAKFNAVLPKDEIDAAIIRGPAANSDRLDLRV